MKHLKCGCHVRLTHQSIDSTRVKETGWFLTKPSQYVTGAPSLMTETQAAIQCKTFTICNRCTLTDDTICNRCTLTDDTICNRCTLTDDRDAGCNPMWQIIFISTLESLFNHTFHQSTQYHMAAGLKACGNNDYRRWGLELRAEWACGSWQALPWQYSAAIPQIFEIAQWALAGKPDYRNQMPKSKVICPNVPGKVICPNASDRKVICSSVSDGKVICPNVW